MWIPPALVAIVPPTVAESRLERSTPYPQPAAPAASCRRPTVTPAPAVTWPASRSTSSSRSRRRRLSTTSPPRGTPPPTSPVFPPWGTRGTPVSRQTSRTPATSAVDRGRTTAGVVPQKRPVQSLAKAAHTSGSVATPSPTTSRSRPTSPRSPITPTLPQAPAKASGGRLHRGRSRGGRLLRTGGRSHALLAGVGRNETHAHEGRERL